MISKSNNNDMKTRTIAVYAEITRTTVLLLQ